MEVWINNEVDDASNASTSRWLSAVWWDDDDGGGDGDYATTIDYFPFFIAWQTFAR